MSAYTYGEAEPTMSCGHCDGTARAIHVDIGVGYEQVTPFECAKCGAAYMCVDESSYEFGWVPAGGV
jgi:hypothetical protein